MLSRPLMIVLSFAFLINNCQMAPKQLSQNAKQAITEKKRSPAFDLRHVHDALFEMYFPLEKYSGNEEMKLLIEKVRDEMWTQVSSRPEAVWGFRVLELMTILNGGFSDLPIEERLTFFRKLETSSINNVRKGARVVRLYYLFSIYSSELGRKIAGLGPRPSAFHPDMDEFLETNKLKLPPSPILFDPSTNRIKHKDGPIDVVIVGSGPSGVVIAHEFSRAGLRVVVLEQGSFVVPGAVDTRRIVDLQEGMGIRTSSDGGVIFRNGNAVGGGTTINIDLAFSPLKESLFTRIHNWEKTGLVPPDQYPRENLAAAYSWIEKKVGTRTVSEEEINGNNRILWDGAINSGRIPSLYDLNTYAPGTSSSPVINKKSAVSAFLIPKLEDKKNPLAIIPGAQVNSIIWGNTSGSKKSGAQKVAIGVEFTKVPLWKQPGSVLDPHGLNIPDGTKVMIEAKHVIIASGSLGSPAILLKSGLNNKNIGIGPVAHPSIPLIGEFDKTIKAWEGTSASVFVDDKALTDGTILESMNADVAYVAMMLPGKKNEVFDTISNLSRVGGFGVLLIDEPNNKNRIVLDKKGKPKIQYKLTKNDSARFAKAIADSVKIMFKAGAKKVFLPTNELSITEFSSIEQVDEIEHSLKFISARTTLTSAHLQSSCKMGTTSKNSVVNSKNKVWGTKNVFVVDGSVFPTSVGANPMQTIYTMAKIFSDRWLKEHSH